MTDGRRDGRRKAGQPLPCGTADKTIGYYRVFPRECCGGGRTRSYSASCLSIRLTRPRVWSLLFIGAETLVISQFSYNAVPHGRGLSSFSPVRCQFVRGGQCAALLPLGGKKKNGAGDTLCCRPYVVVEEVWRREKLKK